MMDLSYEEERHVVVGDIECLCEILNAPRADIEEIAQRMEQIAEDIVLILLPTGNKQGYKAYGPPTHIPECFEERCRMLCLQIKEYAMELRHSPNLAYHISWALWGIMFLVATLTICKCNSCDEYAKDSEVRVYKYARQSLQAPYYLTRGLGPIYYKIHTNFEVLRFRPSDSECRCHQCSTRSIIR